MSSTAHCSLSDLATKLLQRSTESVDFLSSICDQHLTELWKSLGRATPRMRRPRERTCHSRVKVLHKLHGEGLNCIAIFATFLA